MKICQKCKYWGDGDGTGIPYDAGHVNYCKQPQIDGEQHPSIRYGREPASMVMTEHETQHIMTRWNFGCVLHKE